MLKSLHLKNVGPAASFDLELGERLNVLTGDNGLGKSFILEVAWWALTGTWVGRPVLPRRGGEDQAAISSDFVGSDSFVAKLGSEFSRHRQAWSFSLDDQGDVYAGVREPGTSMPRWLESRIPVVFVRVDGISVWDPARLVDWKRTPDASATSISRGIVLPDPFHFGPSELWNGLERHGKPICNGLIQDWSRWWLEARGGRSRAFDLLSRLLSELSHPAEKMTAGEPRRLYLDDSRDYPTIDLPYGNVPAVHASAGMKRILTLAYLLTWTWTEHEKACELLGIQPSKSIVFLVDEIESHLHPRWQRTILPSLLTVLKGLGAGVKPQVLLTTHSPLVLASLEPHFVPTQDRLFLFEQEQGTVSLRDVPWTKHGDAVGWLTSEIGGLEQARSVEAERAIDAAYDFMAGRQANLHEGLRTAEEIDRELHRVLADQDRFWPRWVVWQERQTA